MESSIHSFIYSFIQLSPCCVLDTMLSWNRLILCPFPHLLPILSQDELLCSAVLTFFRFSLKGTSLSPSISKPFPNLDSAPCFQGGPWQIIKREEHEVGLQWVGKPHTYLLLFSPAHVLVPLGSPNELSVPPFLPVQWKGKDLSSSRLDFIP